MRNRNAFTLIEVLIALLIIAIALAAAIRATNNSVRASIHVKNTVTAHWVGLNILSEIQTNSGVAMPKPGSPVLGKTKMLNQEWDWIAQAKTASQLNNITQITVTVSLKNKVINSVEGYVS